MPDTVVITEGGESTAPATTETPVDEAVANLEKVVEVSQEISKTNETLMRLDAIYSYVATIDGKVDDAIRRIGETYENLKSEIGFLQSQEAVTQVMVEEATQEIEESPSKENKEVEEVKTETIQIPQEEAPPVEIKEEVKTRKRRWI